MRRDVQNDFLDVSRKPLFEVVRLCGHSGQFSEVIGPVPCRSSNWTRIVLIRPTLVSENFFGTQTPAMAFDRGESPDPIARRRRSFTSPVSLMPYIGCQL
jgi:hypothetical protein